MTLRTSPARVALLAAALLAACTATGPDAAPTDAAPTDPAAETADVTLVHHEINYIEIPVTDMAAAQRFYGEAFGWRFTDYGPEYAGIQRQAGGESGGLRLDAEVRRGGPLVILYSDDLDASVASVRAAGGTILVEPFDFPGGRRFHFEDPSGNELAVWALPPS